MIDDEPFFARGYVDNLVRDGHHVLLVMNADSAYEELHKERHYDIIILDVMMAAPAGIPDAEVNSGLDTGIYLLKRLLKEKAKGVQDIPIVILTNRTTGYVKEAIAALNIPNTYVRSKIDTPASYLPKLLEDITTGEK